MLEIIDSLLKHLKQSVMTEIPVDDVEAVTHEKLYQESLINALAEFAYHLPHYHKIEIMMFIIQRTPGTGAAATDGNITPAEILLQHMLLKCLVKVQDCFHPLNFAFYPEAMISDCILFGASLLSVAR